MTSSHYSNRLFPNEPSLQELLRDPTIRTVMKRDGVHMNDLIDLIMLARKRLLAKRWRRAV